MHGNQISPFEFSKRSAHRSPARPEGLGNLLMGQAQRQLVSAFRILREKEFRELFTGVMAVSDGPDYGHCTLVLYAWSAA